MSNTIGQAQEEPSKSLLQTLGPGPGSYSPGGTGARSEGRGRCVWPDTLDQKLPIGARSWLCHRGSTVALGKPPYPFSPSLK